MNGERIGTFELGRSNAFERIVENVHCTVTFTLQNLKNHCKCQKCFTYSFLKRCQGYSNSLFVQWECLSPVVTATQTTTTSSLPYCTTDVEITGSCSSSNSPYEPRFLSKSTDTFFEYPISQSIVCESGTTGNMNFVIFKFTSSTYIP